MEIEFDIKKKDNNNKKIEIKENKEDISFKYGFNIIFQQWSAFRFALENTPEALNRLETIENSEGELEEDLEIVLMLEALEFDILTLLQKNLKSKQYCVKEVSELLLGFMEDYFDLELGDNSHIDIATWIYNFYSEFKDNKTVFLDKLKKNLVKFNELYKFTIGYPIDSKSKSLGLVFNNEDNKKTDEKKYINSSDVNNEKPDELNNIDSLNSKVEKMDIDEEDGFVVVKKKGKKC